MMENLFSTLRKFALKAGRSAARQLLRLYYVLKEGDLTSSEKIWVYAALVYILVPGDLIPRRIFRFIGLADDAAAVAYIVTKVNKKLTPLIEQHVEMKLDEWFGYHISTPAQS